MPSRRQLLAAVAGAIGAGYLAAGGDPVDPVRNATADCPGQRTPRWRLHGEGWSPAVVDGGTAFVSERRGYTGTDAPSRIAAVDTYYGHARWAYTVGGGGAGVPLVTPERVYVGTGVDTVLALDRETGHLVYVLDQRGVVHVLDDGSRRRRFRVTADGTGEACGWDPWHHRGTGVTLRRGDLYVTGPWVGRFGTFDPNS